MFGLGFTEIAVVCLLAVILFPPRELPKLARGVARFYGSIRRTAEDFKAAILEDPDLNEPIDEIKNAYRKSRFEVRRAEDAARRELAKARMEARMAVRRHADADSDSAIHGRVAVGEPESPPAAPLSVASEPVDAAGGDSTDRSQGAA